MKIAMIIEATALALFNFKTNFMFIETTIEENRDLVKPYFTDFDSSEELSKQEAVEIGAHALCDCINSSSITLPMCRAEMECFLCDEDDDWADD